VVFPVYCIIDIHSNKSNISYCCNLVIIISKFNLYFRLMFCSTLNRRHSTFSTKVKSKLHSEHVTEQSDTQSIASSHLQYLILQNILELPNMQVLCASKFTSVQLENFVKKTLEIGYTITKW
jgi:hypothetical protein